MEWVEVTARTVEDAKDKALDYLGVDESQAEFEVLEEPRTGLFGRLKGEARVRARVRPTQPRPKLDRRDRRRRKPREDERGHGETPRAARTEAPEEPPASREAEPAASSPAEEGPARSPERRAGRPRPTSQEVDSSEERPGGRNRRPRSSQPSAPRTVEAERTAGAETEEGFVPVSEEVNEEAVAREVEAADAFLRGLLEAFGMPGDVETVVQDDQARELRVTGSDLGLLIGPRGGTIEAVQELTRLAARRSANGRSEARIRVDVGGYRERRREALARFARRLAEEVRDTGVQKVLEPMSSPDRKIVHDAAGEVDGVTTLSEGEEPRRRVVIVPRG